jgi:hypothetical protein
MQMLLIVRGWSEQQHQEMCLLTVLEYQELVIPILDMFFRGAPVLVMLFLLQQVRRLYSSIMWPVEE